MSQPGGWLALLAMWALTVAFGVLVPIYVELSLRRRAEVMTLTSERVMTSVTRHARNLIA